MSPPKTNDRDAILTKLRNAVANPQGLFRSQNATEPTATTPSAVTDADGAGVTLAKIFGERLEEVLGSYEYVKRANDVPKKIVEQIQRWREETDRTAAYGSEVLSWGSDELPIPNLRAQLEERQLSLFVPTGLHDNDERAHAATLAVGLTGVDAAFAGTGSMVLVPGPGKSRAASLFPLHHIALVPISKIHSTFESWLASLRDQGMLEEMFRENSQLAFITGPSKSADIELNLTLGVHGPRDVHAIIFDDGA